MCAPLNKQTKLRSVVFLPDVNCLNTSSRIVLLYHREYAVSRDYIKKQWFLFHIEMISQNHSAASRANHTGWASPPPQGWQTMILSQYHSCLINQLSSSRAVSWPQWSMSISQNKQNSNLVLNPFKVFYPFYIVIPSLLLGTKLKKKKPWKYISMAYFLRPQWVTILPVSLWLSLIYWNHK